MNNLKEATADGNAPSPEGRQVNYEAMNDPYSFVPHHMRDGYRLWIERGISPGSFGRAILDNDLAGACGKADTINQNHIFSTVAWFYNFAPSSCWGSREKTEAWEQNQ